MQSYATTFATLVRRSNAILKMRLWAVENFSTLKVIVHENAQKNNQKILDAYFHSLSSKSCIKSEISKWKQKCKACLLKILLRFELNEIFPFYSFFSQLRSNFFCSCLVVGFSQTDTFISHTLYLPFLYGVHQISNEKLSVIAIFAMASVPVRFLCSGAPVSETNVIYND